MGECSESNEAEKSGPAAATREDAQCSDIRMDNHSGEAAPAAAEPSAEAPVARGTTDAMDTTDDAGGGDTARSGGVTGEGDEKEGGDGNKEQEAEEDKKGPEVLLIPKAAVKRIMKLDPEVNQVANDAVILVAKATEMFLEKFSNDARALALAEQRANVKYEDLADACHKDPNYEFLPESVIGS